MPPQTFLQQLLLARLQESSTWQNVLVMGKHDKFTERFATTKASYW
jgi:hypothetical protein